MGQKNKQDGAPALKEVTRQETCKQAASTEYDECYNRREGGEETDGQQMMEEQSITLERGEEGSVNATERNHFFKERKQRNSRLDSLDFSVK